MTDPRPENDTPSDPTPDAGPTHDVVTPPTPPGKTPTGPATGGDGAEGAGGPDGFGTGT